MKNKLISVIGLGYIGLPTAALLANHGFSVLGVDTNQNVVNAINQGETHIFEPDLEIFVRSAIDNNRLKCSKSLEMSDIYIICVPTPIHIDDTLPMPDIESVIAAIHSIAPFVKSGDLVILESTSPVGTTEKIEGILRDSGAPVDDVHIAYCPERVLPGKVLKELVENDRIIGGLTLSSTLAVANFFRTFVKGNVLETDAKTAEMCKLTENSFRDVNIAFANELSLICDKEGIDVWNLIKLANRHPRVNILQPSTGVGGHCIAVDPWFIVARDKQNSRLIRTAREVNNYKAQWVIDKIQSKANDFYQKKRLKPRIVCLGLAFKPDIDDLRESPALEVANSLKSRGYEVLAIEPNINSHITFEVVQLEELLSEDLIFVILVKHKQFMTEKVKDHLISLGALDFCGLLA